jgi:16S rRNA processing protein RimM
MSGARFADLVLIGRVVKPQGRKGEVLVAPCSDRPERFPGLRQAWVPAGDGGSRRVEVTSCWPHKGRFVLKLDGIDSIDAAETLRGAELRLDESELAALPEGSYYFHELQGLRVEAPSGEELGRVDELLETGAAVVLVVRGAAGETLVPLAEPFVRSVDLARGLIVVELLETVEC